MQCRNYTRFVCETVIASTKQCRWEWFMLWPRQRRDIKQWRRLCFARLKLTTSSRSRPFWNATILVLLAVDMSSLTGTGYNRRTIIHVNLYLAVGCWRGYLPAARCRFAYSPADATALNVSCFSKVQIGFIFLVLAHLDSPWKGH